MYIANRLSYKIRNDLKIYKKIELESTFIEIINPRKSNIIVGVIYKHPIMDVTDFNNNFLNNLLKKINQEQKKVFLLGDFNIDLMHYNEHKPTNEFLDSLPLILTCYISSNLVDIQAIQEPLVTIFSVMSSQKTLFVVILQLPFLTIYPSFWSHRTLLLIHPPINLMFLKEIGQNLTRKILSWITLIQIGPIF